MQKYILLFLSIIVLASCQNKLSFDVADKSGATIKGVVYSEGRPLAGVSVSDGDDITQTDANGHYWLNSAKRNRLVFVIMPSGYEAKV